MRAAKPQTKAALEIDSVWRIDPKAPLPCSYSASHLTRVFAKQGKSFFPDPACVRVLYT